VLLLFLGEGPIGRRKRIAFLGRGTQILGKSLAVVGNAFMRDLRRSGTCLVHLGRLSVLVGARAQLRGLLPLDRRSVYPVACGFGFSRNT
jgi:hypothetical protein